jgi:hypothetical protein
MRTYRMQGTPTLILIDKSGRLRLHKFGHVSDLSIGFSIGALLSEEVEETDTPADPPATIDTQAGSACDDDGCSV